MADPRRVEAERLRAEASRIYQENPSSWEPLNLIFQATEIESELAKSEEDWDINGPID